MDENAELERVREIIADLVAQDCTRPGYADELDSRGHAAYADAMRYLAACGRVTIRDELWHKWAAADRQLGERGEVMDEKTYCRDCKHWRLIGETTHPERHATWGECLAEIPYAVHIGDGGWSLMEDCDGHWCRAFEAKDAQGDER